MGRMLTQSVDTIEVPIDILEITTSEPLARQRESVKSYRTDSVHVPVSVAAANEDDLVRAAETLKNGRFLRGLKAIINAERGEFGLIPNAAAAPGILTRFLAANNPSGWIYKQRANGVQPFLVTSVDLRTPRGSDSNEPPSVSIGLSTVKPFRGKISQGGPDSITLSASDVSRRAPEKILLNAGYLLETPELRAAYEEELEHFKAVAPDFAEQFRFTGVPTRTDSYRSSTGQRRGRVILDLSPDARCDLHEERESAVTGEVHDVPVMMVLPVFDLRNHDYLTVRAADLEPYVYDKTLADKLVLPESHRSLMDVLTSEIDSFTGDFIEGKSAGNVILCQGDPGVGKTLTAEVYSEIIERPLYSLSTVTLGLTPEKVAESLKRVFEQAQRWNAVLLLDESDVFVTQRGTDLTRDAIVAEFLRVLEYFTGLAFLTTNRSNTIDEAILSRCAAIVPYSLPSRENAKLVWEKIAEINQVVLGKELIDQLVDTFPKAAPRDIKMLLRLVLRVSKAKEVEIDLELFKRYAVFRSMPPAEEAQTSA